MRCYRGQSGSIEVYRVLLLGAILWLLKGYSEIYLQVGYLGVSRSDLELLVSMKGETYV